MAKEYKIRKLYYDEEMSLSDTVIHNEDTEWRSHWENRGIRNKKGNFNKLIELGDNLPDNIYVA